MKSVEETISSELGFFLHGGLHLIGSMKLALRPVEITPQGWEARADGAMQVVLLFRGEWDEKEQVGRIREVIVERVPPMPSEERSRWKIEGWTRDSVVGRQIATRVEHVLPNGRLEYRQAFVRATPEPESRIDELVVVPEYNGSDPIRGTLTVRALSDYRSDSSNHHWVTQSGLARVTPATDRRNDRRGYLQISGWVTIAALSVFLVILHRIKH